MPGILIIKLGALGDAVIASGAIRQICRHHAGGPITLLTDRPLVPLFVHRDDLRVVGFDRHGLLANLKILRWMRGEKFQRLYDLQSSDRSGILCALSGIRERVGNHPRYPYTHHPRDPYLGQVHIYDRLLDVLRAGGIDALPDPPDLPASPADRETVSAWLATHCPGKRARVVLHAGASPAHPEKRWPGFAQLCQALQQHGLLVIWAGGPDDAALNRELSRAGGVDATGAFSLRQLAELGRRARFAVTNDSGPMHVLSCAGIPVYGLFGPTNWRRQHAAGQRERVMATDLASPVFHPAPMAGLSVDAVLHRLRIDGLLG